MRILILVLLLAFVPAVHGATVGTLPPAGGTTISATPPLMLIDFSRPARETATMTVAHVRWVSAPDTGCPAAFKIKFLRPTFNNNVYTVLAERGPFNAVNGINVITLTPSVSVQQFDVIAITQLKPLAGCGGVAFTASSGEGARTTSSQSDPSTGPVSATGLGYDFILNARASTSADVVEGYIVAVGSVQGGFGSNFKTAIQLTNSSFETIVGKLVFHPATTAGSPTDPSLSFSIPPFATVSNDDVVAALGRTGLGSMDLITTNSHPPTVTTRVYNDEGAGGTSGLTFELQSPFDAMRPFNLGQLTAPTDPANFRLNIGVRSLDAGATLNISAQDANGNSLGTFLTRTYPPNYFEQRSAADFVNLPSIPSNAVIFVQVMAGSAFVYGSTTDNRTNDPNVKFFTRY